MDEKIKNWLSKEEALKETIKEGLKDPQNQSKAINVINQTFDLIKEAKHIIENIEIDLCLCHIGDCCDDCADNHRTK